MSDPVSRTPATPAAEMAPATRALDAGLRPDPVTGAIAPNLVASVNNTFTPGSAGFSADGADLTEQPFLYARWTNPTVRALEERLAGLEGGEDALATATGVAAAAAVFLTLLKAGDHLIVSEVCYAGVYELATRILPDLGVSVTPCDLTDPAAVRAALRPTTRLIHAETPCNPILRLTDLAALSAIARKAGVLLSVDSTLATPVITRPLDHGVDLVIHSLTKFMNGHGDALGGAVIGRRKLVSRIRSRAGVYLGASLSAQNAWLILRGLDTLFPRLRMACDTAGVLADWLTKHPAVARVTWPGATDHPQRDLAQRQTTLGGAMIAFQTRAAPAEVARRMADRFRIIHYAFSLGHQRSICVHIGTEEIQRSTFRMEGAALQRWQDWAGEGVFRLSVGLEDPADLIADLSRALD
ncbi:PLP-dependent aspartate aminotransferase family protein [Tabrizicola sp.]|uniref:trans-sulfuration enzyme family protein n=1 Tax=Tabrizicola sp. TaxID=2005166 RepID=UPI0027362B37|nr:aminotransferase class V-fold PLP-dependent enzyme [Tabrizicola sp.]MDP3195508.1 aminotransferase class V-fold PLP-dependent enzyme [Tabrizicola sp.]